MYFYDRQIAGFQDWQDKQPSVVRMGEVGRQRQVRDQIQYIDADVTRVTKDKRVQMSFRHKGAMSNDRKERFIKRFIDPMLKHELGRNLLVAVNQGNHLVGVAWRNGKFGFNGTIAIDRKEAVGGSGSAAVIFIDEEAADLKTLPTIIDNPDIGLFHEFLHAYHIQRGTVVNNEEEWRDE